MHKYRGTSPRLRLDSGEVRYYTVREAATLQTFPPTWEFDEAWSRAFVEIGNAVPPILTRALGAAVVVALDAADEVASPDLAPRPRVRLQDHAKCGDFGTVAIAADVQTSCAAPSPPNSPNPTPPWLRPKPSPSPTPTPPPAPGNRMLATAAAEATTTDLLAPNVTWVKATALVGTPFERIARLVAARIESFARPAPLLALVLAHVRAQCP